MNKKRSGNTVERVYEFAKPLADEPGLFIWDIRFEKEGSNWFLRVFIDKEGGIFIEDCEAITRPLNKILDEEDPVGHPYIFEVCSTGLGRELRKKEHFERYIGSEVRVRLIRAAENIREMTGILLEYNKDTIKIKTSDETTDIRLADCAYVRLNDDQDLF